MPPLIKGSAIAGNWMRITKANKWKLTGNQGLMVVRCDYIFHVRSTVCLSLDLDIIESMPPICQKHIAVRNGKIVPAARCLLSGTGYMSFGARRSIE